MFFKRLRRQEPRQPIAARTINGIADAAEWAGRIRASAPLSLSSTAAGPLLRMNAPASIGVFRGKVTTAIPTGTIGTPSNTGRFTIYNWDGTNSTAGMTGLTVLNDFTIAASVPVNTVIRVAKIDGAYWLVSCECF